MEWKGIEINRSLIHKTTERAARISMPRFSDYSGYAFWHPAKLIWDNFGVCTIRYTDDFIFKLQKSEKDKRGVWEVVDEVMLSPDELKEILEQEEPLIYTPKLLEPEHATVDESLVDDE